MPAPLKDWRRIGDWSYHALRMACQRFWNQQLDLAGVNVDFAELAVVKLNACAIHLRLLIVWWQDVRRLSRLVPETKFG